MSLGLNTELVICRYKKGIQLISPTLLNTLNNEYQTRHTVKDILQQPLNFYFLDTQGQTLFMNEESALMCGFGTIEESIGKSLIHVSKPDCAQNLINNCTQVIHQEMIQIFDEKNIRNDGTNLNFLSIKCPWYDEQKEIIGVFGCSIVLGKHSIADSLSKIVTLGLFDSNQIPLVNPALKSQVKINKNYLSKRELDCLRLTIKGYTAKRIARVLGISHRTVEEYLLNIRLKTGTSSKSELIEMAIDYFIPEGF